MSAILAAQLFTALLLKNETTECPNHGGSFDCTPFCPICQGEQEYGKE